MQNYLQRDPVLTQLLEPTEKGTDLLDESPGVLDRDRTWLDWHDDGGSQTYHNPAAIRDKWNRLSNEERRVIDARSWQRVGIGPSGREMVKRSLARAKQETRI